MCHPAWTRALAEAQHLSELRLERATSADPEHFPSPRNAGELWADLDRGVQAVGRSRP
jgi:hypothetical protein